MDGSLLLWMGLALSIFWSVGVYNRLMRMRARGLSALGSVEKHMRLFADLVQAIVTQGSVGDVHKSSSAAAPAVDGWTRLQAAWLVVDQALKDTKSANALSVAPLACLAQAYEGLLDAWRQLNDVPPDLAGPVVPASMRTQWEAVALRVETARGGFNQILTLYNEALDQFPARLVVGFMGFQPGGQL